MKKPGIFYLRYDTNIVTMNKPLSQTDETLLREAFDAFKNQEIPTVPLINIADIIPANAPRSSVPASAVSPLMIGILVVAFVVIARPFIGVKNPKPASGIPVFFVVQSISGNAFISKGKLGVGREPISAGMFIEEGAHLSTGTDSHLRLGSGKSVNVIASPDTELIVTELRSNEKTPEKHLILTLQSGRIACHVDKITTPVNLRVITPEAQFDVWGTQFEVIHKPDVGSHLGVYEGNVLITPTRHKSTPFHVTGGFQVQLFSNKGLSENPLKPFNAEPDPYLVPHTTLGAAGQHNTDTDDILSKEVNGEPLTHNITMEYTYEDKQK